MFRPSAANSEFIEFYNSSNDTIDIKDYKFKYHTSSFDYIDSDFSSTKIPPQSYAVIFEKDYDTTSGIYTVPPTSIIMKITSNAFGSSGMANSSSRTVLFISPDNDTVCTYQYSANNSAGFSDEKIQLTKDNSDINWDNSNILNGTPGYKNSVAPKDNDLSITSFSSYNSKYYEDEKPKLKIVYKNIGKNKASDFNLEIYSDENRNNQLEFYERITSAIINNVDAGVKDSIDIEISKRSIGYYKLFVKINYNKDENSTNDTLSTYINIIQSPKSYNDIIINEFMYRPIDDEPEWIELYNTTNQSITLNEWSLEDSRSRITFDSNVEILPKSFLVLTKDISLIDFYEIPTRVIQIKNLPSLNNSGDDIKLVERNGTIIDYVSYKSDWGGYNDGKSLERKEIHFESNKKETWQTSKSIYKATPGKINSVTQKQYDLEISINKELSNKYFEGKEIEINFLIKNIGKKYINNFSLEFWFDKNQNKLIDLNEIESNSYTINEDSLLINIKVGELKSSTYYYNINVVNELDNDTTNNFAYDSIYVNPKPAKFNDIVINEIMYNPIDEQPEWVELYNGSNDTIDIRNWSFADRNSNIDITNESTNIYPNEYFVLSEDESINEFYNIKSKIIYINLPSLNNNGDDLDIFDQYNNVIDSVLYFSNWSTKKNNSLERNNYESNSNDINNWKSSLSSNYATPGRINSISPKENDLQILNFSPTKNYYNKTDTIEIFYEIINNGNQSSTESNLWIYFLDDSLRIKIPPIEPNYTYKYFVEIIITEIGNHKLFAKLLYTNDQFPDNNNATTIIKIVNLDFYRNDLSINELLKTSNNDFIELYNSLDIPINLSKFSIYIDDKQLIYLTHDTLINPNSYFSIFESNMLSKNANKIVVKDSLDRTIDSLDFTNLITLDDYISFEKIDPRIKSNKLSNWSYSKYDSNSIGKINSLTPKEFDVELINISYSPLQPNIGDLITVDVKIKNIGNNSLSGFIELKISNNLYKSNFITLNSTDSITYKFDSIYKLLDNAKIYCNLNFKDDLDFLNNFSSINIIPSSNYNDLVINEVMFLPQNGEPEWIELKNISKNSLNILGWKISDILTTPNSSTIIDSISIQPNKYIVISKDSSITNYYSLINSKLIINKFPNLNNSSDGLVIKDANNKVIDSLFYDNTWNSKSGYSLERINETEETNNYKNWGISKDINQATPGKINSLTHKDYDLAIDSLSFFLDNQNNIECELFLINLGKLVSTESKLFIYINNLLYKTVQIENLIPNSSQTIKFNISAQNQFPINLEMFIKYNIDQNTTNNKISRIIYEPYNYNDLLISELMINPNDNEYEWIEFYNNSNKEININNWIISEINPKINYDNTIDSNFIISPNEYFVLYNTDKNFTNPNYKHINFELGSLNNSNDGIVIYDSYLTKIDSFYYGNEFEVEKGKSLERLSFDDKTNSTNNWIINNNGSSIGFINSTNKLIEYNFNDLLINEIMFDPNTNNSEFIEFYNHSNYEVNTKGWSIEIDYQNILLPSRKINPNSYFVISGDSSIFQNYNLTNNNVEVFSKLKSLSERERIYIKDVYQNNIDSINYSSNWHNNNLLKTKNISLERLNFSIDSNDSTNWNSSVDKLGGTPGKKNSIHADNNFTKNSLSISPNPFSPDNDGHEDFCFINFQLKENISQVRARLFDDKGRLVRDLVKNNMYANKGSIIFDGKNNEGNLLRIGMYIIYMEIFNTNNSINVLKDIIVIARKL